MITEEKKLKQDDEIKIKSMENNIKDDNNTTINEEDIKSKINTNTLIHIRQFSSFAESILNYLVIGMCFFIYGCYGLEWFKIAEKENLLFFSGYFLLAGITLYIIGIVNWYEGKELIFLTNFILSFLFIALFIKNQDLGYISENFGNSNDTLQGVFYIVFFCFILIIGISSKAKGNIYIIDYAILLLSYVFLFAYKFFKNDTLKKIDSYIFIVCGAFYWITGILKILNSSPNINIKILEPSD